MALAGTHSGWGLNHHSGLDTDLWQRLDPTLFPAFSPHPSPAPVSSVFTHPWALPEQDLLLPPDPKHYNLGDPLK